VGKTYVGSLIAKALCSAGKCVGVYKPAASGCEMRDGQLVSSDAFLLWEAAGRPGSLDRVCPQTFAAPLAPHLAARAEGRRVDPQLLRAGIKYWQEESEIVLVEGVGGLMSPLGDDDYNADLAAEFNYPLVVVAENALGTINATLQTLIAACTYCEGLPVAGVVLNSPSVRPDDLSIDSNRDELERRCVAPVLAAIEHGGTFDQAVDWWELAETESGGRSSC
jgi:dethiobiotin synthetase